MITALVILAVVLTILVAVGLVAMVSDSGIFGWFAINGIVNTAVEVVGLLLKCLE